MPTFPDPDIDPALNEEAQAVVDEAAKSMKHWLDREFDRIDQSVQRQLDEAVMQIEQMTARLAAEDAKHGGALEKLLDQIGDAAKHLTPLDEDQRRVMEQLDVLSESVKAELAARTERWQGLGTKAVELISQSLKRSLGGII